jgi:Acetyltransferase (GNAT) family.
LIDRALLQAGRQGATRVHLNVIRGNEAALRTYRRAGFREAVAPSRVDVIPMELQL